MRTAEPDFRIAPGIARDARMTKHAYRIPGNMPEASRALRIFAIDPSVSRLDGAVALVRVPHEALEPGPRGVLFAVDNIVDGDGHGVSYRPARLDDMEVIRDRGYQPDPADARFHCQNVYAVAMLTYERFRRALGRMTGWAFWDEAESDAPPVPLTLRPFGMRQANAYYDRRGRQIVFGFVESEGAEFDTLEGKIYFSSLSADVVAHEVSHAILDGLRADFFRSVHPDVLGFHEGFCDLIALFQRFSFDGFLRAAVGDTSRDLATYSLISRLAPELARAARLGTAVRTFGIDEAGRSVLDPDFQAVRYDPGADMPPHHRGRILAEAVFEAFTVVVQRRTKPIITLATGRLDLPRDAPIHPELVEQLVRVSSRVARQFCDICIRAIDYCPPTAINFGDYLRALITADKSLVGDDPYGYREAIVDAFRRRGIYPRDVPVLSESALMWRTPQRPVDRIEGLALTNLEFIGDPGIPARPEEIRRQAGIFGQRLESDPALYAELGLVRSGDPSVNGDRVDPPVIHSVRPARRVGPDGQILFDVVIEVLQTRNTLLKNGNTLPFKGGATVILGPRGEFKYVIRKRIDNADRLAEEEAFSETAIANGWLRVSRRGRIEPDPGAFRSLCLHRGAAPAPKKKAGGRRGTKQTKRGEAP